MRDTCTGATTGTCDDTTSTNTRATTVVLGAGQNRVFVQRCVPNTWERVQCRCQLALFGAGCSCNRITSRDFVQILGNWYYAIQSINEQIYQRVSLQAGWAGRLFVNKYRIPQVLSMRDTCTGATTGTCDD